jgi:small subunit ribosomal protein S16
MLKIRLRRVGTTHAPFYRVVVSDSRKTPSSTSVEQIGHYDPKTNPATIKIDRERVDYWVSKGAQLSPTVKSLLKKIK